MTSLRQRLANKQAKKNQARAVYSSDPIGSVGLWYGTNNVVFRGNVTFGDYKDEDAVRYGLLMFEPDQSKKYIYSGIVTLPKEGRGRAPKVGTAYIYESQKQAAYMMIYIDTDVENESEVFVSPLVEGNSDNPKACALFGKLYEATNKENEDNDKKKLAKAQKVLNDNKRKADDWYTDLEPSDLITIIKSYDDKTLDKFFELLREFVDKKPNETVEPHSVEDVGYELAEDDDDEDDNDEYEEEDVEDEVEEEMPYESAKDKLRIKDIAKKSNTSKPSKLVINRISSQFFEGLDNSDVEEII